MFYKLWKISSITNQLYCRVLSKNLKIKTLHDSVCNLKLLLQLKGNIRISAVDALNV